MPRTVLEPRFQVEYLSILDSDGNLDSSLEPDIAPADLKRLYRGMLLGRRLDERMIRLQRQGRIGTFAPIKGQEASQLGSVFTLRRSDWMVPSFRETAAMLWRGWPIEKLLMLFAGRLEGGQPDEGQNDLPITIPVATGESLFGRREYRPFFEAGSMDSLIVDVPWNGLAESLKIAAMADAYEVNVAPHNFYSHLATMMSMHLCAVAPNVRIMETDVDQAPWVDDLVTVKPTFRDGYLALPTGIGWGTEINVDAVRAHPPRGASAFPLQPVGAR